MRLPLTRKYVDSGSPLECVGNRRQAVRHVEEFSCSLADFLERRIERFFPFHVAILKPCFLQSANAIRQKEIRRCITVLVDWA